MTPIGEWSSKKKKSRLPKSHRQKNMSKKISMNLEVEEVEGVIISKSLSSKLRNRISLMIATG